MEGSTAKIAHSHGSCLGARPRSQLAVGRPLSLAAGKRPQFLAWASPQAAGVSSQHGGHLPPERTIQKTEQGGSHSAFYDLVSEAAHCHCHFIVFFISRSLCPAHPGQLGTTQVITMYSILWSLFSLTTTFLWPLGLVCWVSSLHHLRAGLWGV